MFDPDQHPPLELVTLPRSGEPHISRAVSRVKYSISGPNTGSNPGGGRIQKKKKKKLDKNTLNSFVLLIKIKKGDSWLAMYVNTQLVFKVNFQNVLSLFTYILYCGNRGIHLTSFSSISHCSNSENWPQ